MLALFERVQNTGKEDFTLICHFIMCNLCINTWLHGACSVLLGKLLIILDHFRSDVFADIVNCSQEV